LILLNENNFNINNYNVNNKKNLIMEDIYEGELKNELRNGKGICYYKNGNKFDGEWKNNKRDGKDFYLIINY
jgi:hypothetical protein